MGSLCLVIMSCQIRKNGNISLSNDLRVGEQTGLKLLANFPGIPSCQTKMVLGRRCAEDVEINDTDMIIAKRRISQYKFVGLTEEWNRSICLFHKMLGGIPREVEYLNLHPGTYDKEANRSKMFELHSKDRDTELYRFVQTLVHERFAQFEC